MATQSPDSKTSFKDTPTGWQERWDLELDAARERFRKFQEQGDKVRDVYLDKRDEYDSYRTLNLLYSGVNTIKSVLYGQVPRVEFDRRHADADDDAARIASAMYERILNADIERPDDDYTAVLRYCLEDFLLPGMGQARVRYTATQAEDGTLIDEQAVIDYVYWKDFLYSQARTWHEVSWVAFRNFMTYDELEARFGEKKARAAPLTKKFSVRDSENTSKEIWRKAEVWEIWDKDSRRVFWVCQGMTAVLDSRDDPLGLTAFFPCPRPLLANSTTTDLIPRADYIVMQDLYQDVDRLHERITMLTDACKVVGVYDKANGELGAMLKSPENRMIPVDNWAMFGEKGGVRGSVDWFPLEVVVGTLDKLRELRSEMVSLVFQVTGLSDIIRGQAQGSTRVSATEQKIKAQFASVRIQALQEDFARFGTDLQRLKGEIIGRMYDAETLITRSNILYTPDGQDANLLLSAVQLLKSREDFLWRIAVRPESLAAIDYGALQQERGEFLNGMAIFLQSAAPIQEAVPGALPYLLEMLKWGLAGFKGSQQIEGALDRAIAQARNTPPEPPSEDGGQAEAAKSQVEMAKAQVEMQKLQMQMQIQQQKAELDAQEMQRKHEMKVQELVLQFELKMREMQVSSEAQVRKAISEALAAARNENAAEREHERKLEIMEAKSALQVEPSADEVGESGGMGI